MVLDLVLIASMLLGIVLIIISIKFFNKESKNFDNNLEAENIIQAIDASIKEADNAMLQINKLSKSVFEEYEEKYQELLFLYSLVDDKKKEVSELYSRPSASPPPKKEVITEVAKPNKVNSKRVVIKNPHFDEILRLSEEGASISDISKSLNLGQGEVKLILDMGKDR